MSRIEWESHLILLFSADSGINYWIVQNHSLVSLSLRVLRRGPAPAKGRSTKWATVCGNPSTTAKTQYLQILCMGFQFIVQERNHVHRICKLWMVSDPTQTTLNVWVMLTTWKCLSYPTKENPQASATKVPNNQRIQKRSWSPPRSSSDKNSTSYVHSVAMIDGGFLSHRGTPVIIHFVFGFSPIHHPAMWDSPWKPPYQWSPIDITTIFNIPRPGGRWWTWPIQVNLHLEAVIRKGRERWGKWMSMRHEMPWK